MAADIRTSTTATWPATEPYCTRSSVQATLLCKRCEGILGSERQSTRADVGGGGGVEVAIADFKAEGDFKISAINQETNAGTHNQGRAMSEAAVSFHDIAAIWVAFFSR